MSIIYDALKKAEEAIKINSKTQTDIKDSHSKSKLRTYLLYTLLVCLVLFIGNAVPPPVSLTEKPKEVKPSFQETSTVSVKKENTESLVLSGIFFSEDQGYALINNQIVKVGDTVGGGIVKRINPHDVELEVSGAEVKLSTRPK